jgi:hypothetical protein
MKSSHQSIRPTEKRIKMVNHPHSFVHTQGIKNFTIYSTPSAKYTKMKSNDLSNKMLKYK